MIVCENCGAADDEAMDVKQTIAAKHHRIRNHTCKKCGSHELVMLDFMGTCLLILEEWDDEEEKATILQ